MGPSLHPGRPQATVQHGLQHTAHHPCLSGSLFRYTHCNWYDDIDMRGANRCQWLVIGRSCMGDYCNIHLARLRKGPGTNPCQRCGKGVKNNYRLCQNCGYHRALVREQRRKHKAFERNLTGWLPYKFPFREQYTIRHAQRNTCWLI